MLALEEEGWTPHSMTGQTFSITVSPLLIVRPGVCTGGKTKVTSWLQLSRAERYGQDGLRLRWPSSSWSWCLDADLRDAQSSRRCRSWATFPLGWNSIIVWESIIMPRKVNLVQGPSTFSGATRRPRCSHKGVAIFNASWHAVDAAGKRNHPGSGESIRPLL